MKGRCGRSRLDASEECRRVYQFKRQKGGPFALCMAESSVKHFMLFLKRDGVLLIN